MLNPKTALITGSTQGLGLAAAERFAAAGCDVVINGLIDLAQGDAIRLRLEREHGIHALFSGADLRHPAEIEEMIATVVRVFGSVDILVNNAVVRNSMPIDRMSSTDWDDAVAVNLTAAFHTIRLVLPLMRTRGWGRILNVSSIYGQRGAADRAAYVTTKTALIGLTRAVALETTGDNITCNAVCPGTVRTPVHEANLAAIAGRDRMTVEDAERVLLAGKQPTGRLIEPSDVAGLMLFLCGDESRDITGSVFPVDGGWSAG